MPKIDFTQTLLDFEGKAIDKPIGKCPTCEQELTDGTPWTAKEILMRVANMPLQNDPKGEKAIPAFHAGLKVAGAAEMKAEDVTLLKERLFASSFSNLIKGRVAAILDQKEDSDGGSTDNHDKSETD